MSLARQNENIFIRNATAIAIGGITVLMLGAALMFWRQGEASREAKGWVDHTYEVIQHVESLSDKLKDSEVSRRGYLLTGDERFLEAYRTAMADMPIRSGINSSVEQRRSLKQELAYIRSLTSDNPAQQSNLDEMDGLVAQYLGSFQQSIQERKGAGSTAASDLTDAKDQLDHARSLIRIMVAEESHLLALRNTAAQASESQSNTLTFSSIALFYLVIVMLVWIYQRGQTRSRAQMLEYTQELERSEEELKAQQEELKTQQEELKASNEEIAASNEELEEKTSALEEQNERIRRQAGELEEAKGLIEEKVAELEQSSRYKSEFLANMSHELRTPLNSLLILARGLASNEDGNLTEEQIEEASVIHNGGLELLSLINDILDLSKVEAGKISVIPEDVFLADLVKHLTQQFGPVATEKSVPLKLKLDDSLPEAIHTDGQRVEQILKNLLSNAFKFTEKGSVTLEIARCRNGEGLQRASLAGSDALSFAVTDTGIGIDPSKMKDIFEAFQQENGSIDRHYGGTGLGLTIARKFAHLLGGEIQVRSTKGSGSTFTLFLPLSAVAGADADAAPGAEGEAPVPVVKNMLKTAPKASPQMFVPDDRKSLDANDKVLLIVEDDRDFAATLIKIARKRGYKCLAAGDGKSALVLAAEEHVTAVLLDLKLPDIDGLCVLDQLKHDLRTRHIPVHIVSGREEPDTATSLRKGAIGVLKKPVSTQDLEGAFSRIEGLLHSEGKRVLVVEDDRNTQTAILSLLKQKNLEITVVGSGNAAYEKLKTARFDCVILDLSLPDMTGFEWLEASEAATGLAELPPIIIYTAKALTEEENRELNRHTGSIVIKGASSSDRLLDEVTLFLHSVESQLSGEQQAVIRMQHDPDRVLQGRGILLVDDDLRNTFALSKLLKRHGMNVIISDNGQMAIETLEKNRSIDLVVMDIMMPIMDGYQAMREIRSRDAWKNLPIIALTARAMPEEQERCIEAGANDYLVKPLDVERLLTLLRVWLFRTEMAA